MFTDKQIAIMGFGRSGTTWISDILSKSLGKLILFEPFHPCVFDESLDICYGNINQRIIENKVLDHLRLIKAKKNHNRWLLRNHLNSPIERINQDFVEYIWDHSVIAGFKSIRLNYNLGWVLDKITDRPIFVVRHPLAVISSIKNRPMFWEEYGWEVHWSSFLKHINHEIKPDKNLAITINSCVSISEKICLMWALTHVICLGRLKQEELTQFYYEDFYIDPYAATGKLFEHLDIQKNIHPSYIFTPSMMTLKTAHAFYPAQELSHFPDNFWRDHLNAREVKTLNSLLCRVAEIYPWFGDILHSREYIS